MSNEERKNAAVDPNAVSGTGGSWTLDEAPGVPSTPEERLSDELGQTASGMTRDLNDLNDALLQGPGTVSGTGTESPPLAMDAVPPAEGERTPVGPGPALPTPPPTSGGGGYSGQPLKPVHTPEGSDDDRLMSALAWFTMVILQVPVVSVIQLLSPNNRDRSFQRHHAVTSLLFYAAAIVYEIIAAIAYVILGTVTLGCGFACLWIIFLVPHGLALYYAFQAYGGRRVELPFLSDLGRRQGWL